jgi:prolyl-tRNA editing enzyme YbaK/EbsC (Cys-tRNA(Pro) deacylase)
VEDGVESPSTEPLIEHVFEQVQGTPGRGQPVKQERAGAHDTSWDNLPAMDEHPSIAHFRTQLEARGGRGRIVVLPDSVHTAALAAEALGCEVGAIANSLLFAASTESGESIPVLILTSGAHRVDTGKAAAAVGVEALKRATPDFVREHTGQVIGGVSPIAHRRQIRTYLDPTLRTYDEIWAAAGHPAAVFSTTYDELRTMTGAEEIEVN